MAHAMDRETAQRMIDEEFALVKITGIEFDGDDRVVIRGRRDTREAIGVYKLELYVRDGRIDWAADVRHELPHRGPLQRLMEAAQRDGLRAWSGEPVVEAPALAIDTHRRTAPHGDPLR